MNSSRLSFEYKIGSSIGFWGSAAAGLLLCSTVAPVCAKTVALYGLGITAAGLMIPSNRVDESTDEGRLFAFNYNTVFSILEKNIDSGLGLSEEENSISEIVISRNLFFKEVAVFLLTLDPSLHTLLIANLPQVETRMNNSQKN